MAQIVSESTVMILSFLHRQVWANCVDPNQTATSNRVYAVCFSIGIFWAHYSVVKPDLRITTASFGMLRFFLLFFKVVICNLLFG